jgi:hypothetical protein
LLNALIRLLTLKSARVVTPTPAPAATPLSTPTKP